MRIGPSAPAILCVHPNSELYGSDRMFLLAVQALRARWPEASITVVLPGEGVLGPVMRAIEPDVRVEPLFVPRRANLMQTLADLRRLVGRVLHARRMMRGYDLTYINTVVLFDYLIASRLAPGARLIHVHELPTGMERAVFARLLAWSRGRFVFISKAVQGAFPELARRDGDIVWNGTREFAVAPMPPRDEPLRLLMIGRFNGWKGQGIVLEALALLSPQERAGMAVRLVGSVFKGAEHFAQRIDETIARHGLGGVVEVFGFDPEPDGHYQWAEVVLVPSTKPEPFGLVSIEAMASGRAVVAANHGGLAEIVVEGETGRLVEPGDPAALARVIRDYLGDRDLARAHGASGRLRFEREFRQETHMRRIAAAAERALLT